MNTYRYVHIRVQMYNGFDQNRGAATTTEVAYPGLTFTILPNEGITRTVCFWDQLRVRIMGQANCQNFEVTCSNKVLYSVEG